MTPPAEPRRAMTEVLMMTMKRTFLPRSAGLPRAAGRPRSVGLAALALALIAAPAVAQDERPLSVVEWGQQVWRTAVTGDTDGFKQVLPRVEQVDGGPAIDQLRDGVGQYFTNLEAARETRHEQRDTARGKLETELASRADALQRYSELPETSLDDRAEAMRNAEKALTLALRHAVEYQTLSDDMTAALQSHAVRSVIDETITAIPHAEQQRDWLHAQELLFRLRTLYDDTDERAMYAKHDAHMKVINRRISMIAQYAPKHLHELRARQAARLDDPPLGEFNPVGIDDWQTRLTGVDHNMLRRALHQTAVDHIESSGNDGWRPLLHGGVNALRLFATTTALEESFPRLTNDAAVQRWVAHCETQLERLARLPDSALGPGELNTVLNELHDLNQRTLQLPQEVLFHEFGDGAMYELSIAKEDEYTEIIWPDRLRRFRQSTEGNFIGVGIVIGYDDRRDIMVVNPIEGTPAFRAGVLPNDVIASVDGVSTVGWTLNDAVDRITGERGTQVTLELRREGVNEPVKVTMTRDTVKLYSVNGWYKTGLDEESRPVWDWFIDADNRIGYIRIANFSDDTYNDVVAAWNQMRQQQVRGLILDLRHNPGGLLDQAVRISNLFVNNGPIVSIEGKRQMFNETLNARRNMAMIAESNIPIAVLINRGSASASEIVAGALQAHGAAITVGQRTWGKGSVQRVYSVAANAQVKITTQYYRLPPSERDPEGRLVHKRPNSTEWGVDPDIRVAMTPAQIMNAVELRRQADLITNEENGEADRPNPRQLITDGVDPQLETALLLLQARSLAMMAERQQRGARR